MDLAVCQRVVLYLDNMYPTVEIHGDDMVSASAGQQVRDQGVRQTGGTPRAPHVSERLMPFCLTGLVGFPLAWPPLRSSIFILLSWWCSAAEPLVMPALSAWPGKGVCGRESNVYVPVLERPGTLERGAPVLLYGMSDCRE